MNMRFLYGSSVSVVPTPEPAILARATAADLRVLLYLGTCVHAPHTSVPPLARIAEQLSLTESQINASLAFWRGTGVLEIEDVTASASVAPRSASREISPPTDDVAAETEKITADATAEKPRVTVRRPSRKNELPNYTAEEMARLLESTPATAEYIHACEQIWGKLFNTHETNILLGLVDYLGLEWDYVLTLLAHCVDTFQKQGTKKSLRYVEQTAFAYYDEGVTDMEALEERIRRSESLADSESQIRALFGMGARALTPNEKKCFSAWLYDYQYDMTIIRKAYDITVDTKGEASMKYMNSILANWNSDDLRTVEAIDASMAEYKEKHERRPGKGTGARAGKLPEPRPGGSFETDDFFDSAVSKTFADDKT